MANLLDQLAAMTVVVADTGDIEFGSLIGHGQPMRLLMQFCFVFNLRQRWLIQSALSLITINFI